MPDSDSFSIRENKIQEDKNRRVNKYVSNRISGIGLFLILIK